MKFVYTREFGPGVQREDGIVDISSVFSDIRYRGDEDRVPRILTVFQDRRSQIESLAASGNSVLDATLLAPVPRPPKLIAALRNYFEGVDREREPQDVFLESPDSILNPGGTVILPAHEATIFHHEAELGLVIGKQAKDLAADDRALDVLAGYTCAIDVSGRGIGRMPPSRMGKSFSTFTPLGPAIVTTDEIADPQDLQVTLSVDGEPRQSYSTSDMEYSVVELLSFISSVMTLVPGDVIMCGTNHQGLGALQDGDQVSMTIEGVGTLEVDVLDPLKREWARGVDQQMAERTR